LGFPDGSDREKNLPAVQETCVGSLGWEDPPGEGDGYPLQYSCLRIPWKEDPCSVLAQVYD